MKASLISRPSVVSQHLSWYDQGSSLNSSMTLRGLTYLSVDLYSYGRLKAAGPPISNPRGDVQTGCGAMTITVTFKPYLENVVSSHINCFSGLSR
jgi:hypothetical protein